MSQLYVNTVGQKRAAWESPMDEYPAKSFKSLRDPIIGRADSFGDRDDQAFIQASNSGDPEYPHHTTPSSRFECLHAQNQPLSTRNPSSSEPDLQQFEGRETTWRQEQPSGLTSFPEEMGSNGSSTLHGCRITKETGDSKLIVEGSTQFLFQALQYLLCPDIRSLSPP